MKRWQNWVCLTGLMIAISVPASADTLRMVGSGASFPYPLYSAWFKLFSHARDGVRIDYQAKGSGAGVKDFINETVDFAASDAAMTDAEMAKVRRGARLFPVTAGAVVIAYNLGDIDVVRLPRAVYPAIFAGEITRWDDPAIQAANPDTPMPSLPITVVRRADSSGTTYAFTRHLDAVSKSWSRRFGFGKTVRWPTNGQFVSAPKNDGVAAILRQTPGAIGYLEYTYSYYAKLPAAELQNKAGSYVAPSGRTGQAALAGKPLPDDRRLWLSDPEGEQAWPIVTYTWLLIYANNEDDRKAAVLQDFLDFALGQGQQTAFSLGYIPLPDDVLAQVRADVGQIR